MLQNALDIHGMSPHDFVAFLGGNLGGECGESLGWSGNVFTLVPFEPGSQMVARKKRQRGPKRRGLAFWKIYPRLCGNDSGQRRR